MLPAGTTDAALRWFEPSAEREDGYSERWLATAREKQIAPDWDWFVWLVLAGRGFGKTRCGAEWVAAKMRAYPGCRVALVAQAFADGRDTMVEGESGLLEVLEDRETMVWNRSMGELSLTNGSRAKIYSSEKPRQLRGPQHHFAWGDEPATWYDAARGPAEDTTWSNLTFGCRLSLGGSEPQICATGTPRPTRLLTAKNTDPPGLLFQDGVAVTRGHTDENLGNLAPAYRKRVVEPMRGTRLGRQELAAELLEDVEGALWRRSWIDDARLAQPVAPLRRAVLGLDPSDGTSSGDEQGACLVRNDMDGRMYVAGSWGHRESPVAWLEWAVRLAAAEGATIVVEKNHGAAYLTGLLERVMQDTGIRAPYKAIAASVGKRTRAEPVAGLYEQGKVHHLEVFADLEDQMCLAAETLVATISGAVPISDVRTGDQVWTRAGLRRVKWAGQTGVSATLRLRTTGGDLMCTPGHPVLLEGGEFVPAKATGPQSTLVAWGSRSALTAAPNSPTPRRSVAGRALSGGAGSIPTTLGVPVSASLSRVLPTTGSRRATTGPAAAPAGSFSIGPSGKPHTGRSIRPSMFTTATRTRPITGWRTWLRSLRRAIVRSMDRVGLSGGIMSSGPQPAASRGRGGSPTQSSAQSAASPSPRQANGQSSVRPSVGSASVLAVEPGPVVPVFNLEVEGEPEFFANGLLVHNCSWDGTGASPDLMDSMVWAITELMGYGSVGTVDGEGAVPYDARPDGLVAGDGAVAWR